MWVPKIPPKTRKKFSRVTDVTRSLGRGYGSRFIVIATAAKQPSPFGKSWIASSLRFSQRRCVMAER
jgi:hypothetical protein